MLFKKISALVLSLSLVLSSVPSTQAAIFDDVSVSDWFHPFTEQLGAAGIVSTSNGHFYPYRPITRAELAKMVVNTASFQGVVNIASSASVSFCDVDASHWAARFINTLAQTNAVQGQAANCAQGRVFLPDNRVTRAEALKILLGVYAISVRDRGTSFSDVDNNTWYAPFVSQAVQMQLIGDSSNQFRPHADLSRAEMSKLIVKLSEYAYDHDDDLYPLDEDDERVNDADDDSASDITAAPSASAPSSASPTSPTTLGADCRPESCIGVDWRVRARALEIPGYERRVVSGKLVLKSERFQVILPDASPNAEEYGRIRLYQLRLAYAGTRSVLGFEPYALPNSILQEFELNHFASGSCCGPEEDGYILTWNAGTREEYLESIQLEGSRTGYLPTTAWNTVVGDHELVHRFNWTLGLSSFIDEGLANFVQDRGQPQPMVCRQGGYEINGLLTHYDYLFNDSIQMYNTGDCFWQRIEQLYGQNMVQRIVGRFRRKAERDALQTRIDSTGTPHANWTSFSGQILIDLEQAFVPEIGERFWRDFADFCLSPTMDVGKTYDSEASTSCSALN